VWSGSRFRFSRARSGYTTGACHRRYVIVRLALLTLLAVLVSGVQQRLAAGQRVEPADHDRSGIRECLACLVAIE
jgi:hypothetical protein